MRSLRSRSLSALTAGAVVASVLVTGFVTAGTAHAATVTVSKLKLLNGWTDQASGTAKATAALDGSIVTLGGGLQTSGTSPELFVLPATMRPPTNVFVHVSLCNAAHGRLIIAPSGEVDVDASPFSNAQCFVSLDGVTFGVHPGGFHALNLLNGWTASPSGTAAPAASLVNGVVTFRGAVAGGGNATEILKLPSSMRPTSTVRIVVDMCNGDDGWLEVDADGAVIVEPVDGDLSVAQCFTSLDGASFVQSQVGASDLTLLNGWVSGPFGSGIAATEDQSGYIHLSGEISSGTAMFPFVLQPNFRPAKPVYVAVDLCNTINGRLDILPSGTVSIETENGSLYDDDARCFTSLDGVSYEANAYTKLQLINGWQSANINTPPSVAVDNGIVTLSGGMKTAGIVQVAFKLPPGFRPTTTVYVPVDLCNGSDGRLQIEPTGVVEVEVEGDDFTQAQCLTSLDGTSFSIMSATFHALTLANGWTNGPFATNNAAVSDTNGVVTFKGAVSGGSSAILFTLPVADRPTTNVYVKVDLCGATEGSLYIQPSGVVQVQTKGTFADAQCFTSLDGASFVQSGSLQTPLTLINGWTGGPSSTGLPAVEDLAGQVHLSGAIATGTNVEPFVIPPEFAPGNPIAVPITECSGTTGRLVIAADGTAFVHDSDPTFAHATCMTSLDGVTFAR